MKQKYCKLFNSVYSFFVDDSKFIKHNIPGILGNDTTKKWISSLEIYGLVHESICIPA